MADTTRTGVVARLLKDKGFGFIAEDGTGIEHFFHRSEAPDFDRLVEQQRVTFIEGSGAKGPRAEQVRLA